MTSMSFEIDDHDVEEALDRLIALLSPEGLSVFLGSAIGPELSRRAAERFANEGDDAVGKWAPLKEATIILREEAGFGAGPINRRTGELEDWVVDGGWDAYPSGVGASLSFPGSTPSGELRKKVETAQGGRRYPSTVARPVLGLSETDLLFFQAALSLAVEGAIRG